MSKGATTPPMCPICGVTHWFREPHVFGGRVPTPDLMSPRPGSARERQMIDVTPKVTPKAKPSVREKRTVQPPAPLDVARAALAEAEAKPKRKGRPATGFDKKAYDRQKAAERRAAAKAAAS